MGCLILKMEIIQHTEVASEIVETKSKKTLSTNLGLKYTAWICTEKPSNYRIQSRSRQTAQCRDKRPSGVVTEINDAQPSD